MHSYIHTHLVCIQTINILFTYGDYGHHRLTFLYKLVVQYLNLINEFAQFGESNVLQTKYPILLKVIWICPRFQQILLLLMRHLPVNFHKIQLGCFCVISLTNR